MDEKNLEQITQLIYENGTKIGLSLITAILTLVIGLWIIKLILKGFDKATQKSQMDDALRSFLKSVFGTILKVLLGLSVVDILGVETTSFLALLGAAGLAIGMALKGTLSNFAGGVMILLLKPFKIGDFIEGGGKMGVVKEIQIFNTILTTVDNKVIIIPNGGLSESTITNFSKEPLRRVDIDFGIGYGDDIDKAKQVIKDTMLKDERILKDPEYFIAVKELADSSVNFTTRSWVKAADYWGVYFDNMEAVKKALDANNISIPFPQTDVHIIKE